MKLPLQPPIPPMLALLSREIPTEEGWHFELKFDGFRSIIFWDGKEMFIQSRDLKPLNVYFPELEESLRRNLPGPCVVDGEIVISGPDGLDFETLQLRIHPAASRIKKLSVEIPASFVAFDLLAIGSKSLMNQPLSVRRAELESFFKQISKPLHLSPATTDYPRAAKWFKNVECAIGLDGIVAKKLEDEYIPGERVMIKVKHHKTADCVVGGFRWAKDKEGIAIGSLLLGLYDGKILHYVGHTSSFKKQEREDLLKMLQKYRVSKEEAGFGQGRTPGGPSRWTQNRDSGWEALRPELVCEVRYDQIQGHRFRHATTFIRWRDDKPPSECSYDQLAEVENINLDSIEKLL